MRAHKEHDGEGADAADDDQRDEGSLVAVPDGLPAAAAVVTAAADADAATVVVVGRGGITASDTRRPWRGHGLWGNRSPWLCPHRHNGRGRSLGDQVHRVARQHLQVSTGKACSTRMHTTWRGEAG